ARLGGFDSATMTLAVEASHPSPLPGSVEVGPMPRRWLPGACSALSRLSQAAGRLAGECNLQCQLAHGKVGPKPLPQCLHLQLGRVPLAPLASDPKRRRFVLGNEHLGWDEPIGHGPRLDPALLARLRVAP